MVDIKEEAQDTASCGRHGRYAGFCCSLNQIFRPLDGAVQHSPRTGVLLFPETHCLCVGQRTKSVKPYFERGQL